MSKRDLIFDLCVLLDVVLPVWSIRSVEHLIEVVGKILHDCAGKLLGVDLRALCDRTTTASKVTSPSFLTHAIFFVCFITCATSFS